MQAFHPGLFQLSPLLLIASGCRPCVGCLPQTVLPLRPALDGRKLGGLPLPSSSLWLLGRGMVLGLAMRPSSWAVSLALWPETCPENAATCTQVRAGGTAGRRLLHLLFFFSVCLCGSHPYKEEQSLPASHPPSLIQWIF